MKSLIFASAAVAMCAQQSVACDLCSIYAASQAQGGSGVGLFGGVAEQFTDFGALQEDGHKIAGEGQYIHSSVSQLFAGYNINNQLGVQLNVPIIYRGFGSDTMNGVVSGVGDVSLVGTYIVYQKLSEKLNFNWSLLGGIKFPTGDPSQLNTPDSELPEGIGGHDLALGSGSFDGLIGTGAFGRWRHLFATANVQYAIRTEGAFQHRYADDLTWMGGPGVYLGLGHQYTLSLQAMVSGETKGKDTFAGVPDADSAETVVYLGPQLNFTLGSQFSAIAAVDLPLVRNNSGIQVMPDYRVRVAVNLRF